jgi:hypothetical protein
VLAWGPAGDQTLCAMVNDPRVCEPLARRSPCHKPAVSWGNVLPLLPGGQVVAGSNPVSPTKLAQFRATLHDVEDRNDVVDVGSGVMDAQPNPR